MKISNIRVDRGMGDKYALAWNDEAGLRYHVWLNPHDHRPDDPVVYKNPPMGVKYRDIINGYFQTRHLDLNAANNKKAFDEALQFATQFKLFEDADSRVSQAAQEERRAQDLRIKKHLKEQAAEEMFEVLEVIDEWYKAGGYNGDGPSGCALLFGDDETLGWHIRRAMAKARGEK